jgi:hypothetical protein
MARTRAGDETTTNHRAGRAAEGRGPTVGAVALAVFGAIGVASVWTPTGDHTIGVTVS